ncbi:type III PLP-dependent enzyme [Leeia oryzae]|uniref:type III PLP-dependent enzyme n=1 Tax=Leeia oryzae TaxID=356662 RepID=UPI00036147E9|nr:type III PLP-dependent enzyme [Leeia oryzae]
MGRVFDPTKEVQADFALVKDALRNGYQNPFLFIDSSVLREKVRRFKDALPRVRPHFAIKSNPHPEVLTILRDEGAGFEFASPAELRQMLDLGVPARELFYSNPVKAQEAIQAAVAAGVQWYVIDSVEELRKIHQLAPNASYYLRLHTSNEGSTVKLSGKFGAFPEDVTRIITEAVKLGADLAGATFHAGSQCLNPDNWNIGINAALETFAQMRAAGLTPRLLNLGGGFPVEHTEAIPSIWAIAKEIESSLAQVPADIQIIAEPGRFLVSDAGYLVCKVIGITSRQGSRWAYLDCGVFNGLLESITGIEYDFRTDKTGAMTEWTVAGPTCDSMDICTRSQQLPEDLVEGDMVYVRNAGAYSNACAGTFNGFPLPDVLVV